jgi:hypothetical protein
MYEPYKIDIKLLQKIKIIFVSVNCRVIRKYVLLNDST